MGAVSPAPLPGDPLRLVVESENSPNGNFQRDKLECGHEVLDYDHRPVLRRRCRECGKAAAIS